MGAKEKLLAKARNSPANLKFNDLVKLAECCGFIEKRQRGSHVIMGHKIHNVFLNFQNHKGKAKPYQVRQLLKAIEDFNL